MNIIEAFNKAFRCGDPGEKITIITIDTIIKYLDRFEIKYHKTKEDIDLLRQYLLKSHCAHDIIEEEEHWFIKFI